MNPEVSIVEKFGQISGYKNLNDVLTEIRDGKYKLKVEQVRELENVGKSDDANLLKKTLPSFITTGKFVGGHKKENLSDLSGILILDFDYINTQSFDLIVAKARSIPNTLAYFRSPRGNGLKVLVPYSAGKEDFECSFTQIAEYYSEKLGIPVDYSGKDISRLCFYSCDPNLYHNPECEVFQIDPCPEVIEIENEIAIQTEPELTKDEVQINFNKAELHTKRIITYKDGFRNDFVFLLACNCCRFNISLNNAQNLILEKYDYDSIEIKKSIVSAYQNENRNSKKTVIQKDSLFSVTILNLKKYKPEIDLEERILFEAFILKMLTFNGKFFLTIKMIGQEFGIKRKRAENIINKFIEHGLVIKQTCRIQNDGNPRQKNYYTVIPEKIIETSKLMFIDNKEFVKRISPLLVGFIDSRLNNK